MSTIKAQPKEPGKDRSPSGTLEPNAIGLTGVLFQGLATIAPAFGLAVSFQFAVTQAGEAAPLVFVFAAIIILMMAVSVGQLAKAFPSAGGFYTYISRTVHPRAGFMSAWLLSFWLPPATAFALAFISQAILAPELYAQYGIDVPWWAMAIPACVLVATIGYRGIRISEKALIVFGSIEILIMVALGLFGLADPGEGGLSVAPFNPANSLTTQGLYLGVVFSVFAYSGWEAITPLAEESRNPRRILQVALVASVVVIGSMYALVTWGGIIGLGTDNVQAIIDSPRNPLFVLGESLWGGAWVIILFAILNSGLASGLAAFNASTRIWFAMGRSGSLPSQFGAIHAKYRTPSNAVLAEVVVVAVCLVLAAIVGPENALFAWALALTLGLILVYCVANVGVIRHYLGPGRAQFSPLLHIVTPVVASAAVLWVGYKSVVPLPPAPSKYGPIIIGAWFAIGVAVLAFLHLRGNERWLQEAGRAMGEGGSLPSEETSSVRP